jgi:hypothetical protein
LASREYGKARGRLAIAHFFGGRRRSDTRIRVMWFNVALSDDDRVQLLHRKETATIKYADLAHQGAEELART